MDHDISVDQERKGHFYWEVHALDLASPLLAYVSSYHLACMRELPLLTCESLMYRDQSIWVVNRNGLDRILVTVGWNNED